MEEARETDRDQQREQGSLYHGAKGWFEFITCEKLARGSVSTS